MLPRKKLKTASSLVQASPKRKTPVAPAKARLSAIASQYFRGQDARSSRLSPRAARSTLRLLPTAPEREPRRLAQSERAMRLRSSLLFRLFLGTSAVEHSTDNRMVAGSKPARAAIIDFSP